MVGSLKTILRTAVVLPWSYRDQGNFVLQKMQP
jgi:hypothetical protein